MCCFKQTFPVSSLTRKNKLPLNGLQHLELLFKRTKYACLSECLTSGEELLSVYPGVSFGFLQQADPVMHLLRCVAVAVDHTVGRNDDKRVWTAKRQVKNLVNETHCMSLALSTDVLTSSYSPQSLCFLSKYINRED